MRLPGVAIGIALMCAAAGCGGGLLREVEAVGGGTHLYELRSLNLQTVSLPGEEGRQFNSLIQNKLARKLEGYLRHGARWTLVILNVEYIEPYFQQKTRHYKLTLEAQLVDIYGKRGWWTPEGISTPELVVESDVEEVKVREHLVNAVIETLVAELPLHRAGPVE